MPRNYEANKNLRSNSHELRKNMTPQERHLWYDFLNSYEISFRRQVIIRNYIVDFYCRKAKLAVEIDGTQHYTSESIQYDKERTEYLESCGIMVLRFLNKDIDRNFENSCVYIDLNVKQRLG
ncbi:MAG: endonuclease domain-containing protein [Oscillospiraceae bacterium]|nr:endonuclease domain-containing protein [Oscillospiraceae bacterium]